MSASATITRKPATSVDLLIVGRSATIRRSLASCCEGAGLSVCDAPDPARATSLVGMGVAVRLIVCIGPRGIDDLRDLLRRFAALGMAEPPAVALGDPETAPDLRCIRLAPVQPVVEGLRGRIAEVPYWVRSDNDEQRTQYMQDKRELNKARALFLDIVARVDSDTLPGPMVPSLMNELRRTLDNPNLSLADMASFVRPHQSLSTRILTVANSVAYCRGTAVTSLEQALPRIGLVRASQLLRAVATLEYEVGKDLPTRMLIRGLLKHSYLTALIAERLAIVHGHREPGEVYTAALLHNIGSTFFVYTFALLFEAGTAKAITPMALETTAQTGRAQLNQLLGRALDLPPALRHLDDAATSAPDAVERLVIQAAWLAEQILEHSPTRMELDASALLLGLKQPAIDAVNAEMDNVRAAAASFG